jgi:RNA 3'-terminal phosphate cyclase (ATP)
LSLCEAKINHQVKARALVVNLPNHIGERENNILKQSLREYSVQTSVDASKNALSPGNVVLVQIQNQFFTETVSSIGQRGVSAEVVADAAAREALQYLESAAPVGPHLADQLLIPFALAGSGEFRTSALTDHTTTNIEVIKAFLDLNIRTQDVGDETWLISFGP